MIFIIYFVAFFHLTPLIFFKGSIKKNKQSIFILSLLLISFISDFIGLKVSLLGNNTNLITNWYIVFSRILETIILVIPTSFSKKTKLLLVQASILLSLFHIGCCIRYGFSVQFDYLNIFSSGFISILAILSIYRYIYKELITTIATLILIIPSLAILFYTTAMYVPQMITNLDDTIQFPIFFEYICFWVAFGSNVIRDTLFAFFFIRLKMNYDTGK